MQNISTTKKEGIFEYIKSQNNAKNGKKKLDLMHHPSAKKKERRKKKEQRV